MQRAEWLTDKYIMAMLWVYPLFVGFRGYRAITEAKEGFAVVATGLWLAGILLFLLLGLLRGERPQPQLRSSHVALSLFLLAAAISSLASPFEEVPLMGLDFDGLILLVLYGVIFFGVSAFGRPQRKYIWAMAAAVTAGNLIALLQILGGNPLKFYPGSFTYAGRFEQYNGAFLGTMGNIGMLGQYLCIVTPTIAVFGLKSKNPWERALLLLSALFSLVILALSEAEAAYVGALAAALLGPIVLLPTKKQRRIALIVVAALVLLGLLVAFFWPGESGTIWELSRILHGDIRDEFGSSRVEIWRRCLELFPERPLLGAGLGTFSMRADIHWSRYVEAIGDYRYAGVDDTHNLYLGYLMDIGLLGLACYLGLIACSVLTWRKRRFDSPYAAAFGLSMTAALVQDFFCVNICIVAPMMWVVWGLLEGREADTPLPAEEAPPEEMSAEESADAAETE